MQRRPLFVRQADLNDLLDTVLAQLYRHAHKQIVDPIFAFQKNGTGEDLLFVFEDSFRHLDRTETGCIIGRTGFQKTDDLGSTIRGPSDDRIELIFGKKLGDRDAGARRIAGKRDHGIAVPAKDAKVRA